MIAKNTPIKAVHKGKFGGRVRANKRPVNTALKSFIVVFMP